MTALYAAARGMWGDATLSPQ